MTWLLDTNILSELRKGERCDPGVRGWHDQHREEPMFVSVVTIGEIRRGLLLSRRRDPAQAAILEAWLSRLQAASAGRILAVDLDVVERWSDLMVPDPRPVLDALIAATALTHGLTVVTRNTRDFEPMAVPVHDPSSAAP